MAPEMTEITLERSGLRPLRFRGALVWRWETSPDRASPRYSGDPGRWTVLELYETAAGSYLLYEQRCTNWTGERDHLASHQFAALPEVAGWLEQNCPGAITSFCERFEVYEDLREEDSDG